MAKDKLTDLVASRQADNSRSWTVFALMSAINGALLASLHFDGSGGSDSGSGSGPDHEWRLVVALFAIVLCIVWHGMQRRLVAWSRWWENQLADNSEIWQSRIDTKHPGLSTKICIGIIPLMFAAVWEVVACLAMDDLQTKLDWPISIGVAPVAVVCIVIGVLLCCHERSAILKAKEDRDKAEKEGNEGTGDPEKTRKAKARYKRLDRMLKRASLYYGLDVVPIVLGVILLVVLWPRS